MTGKPGTPHDEVYVPDGCDLHPTCSTCPFPDCEYSYHGAEIGKARLARAKARREEAIKLASEGWKVKDIAEHLGVDPPRVWQYLRENQTGT